MSSVKKSENKKSVASKAIPMYRIAWTSRLTNAHGHGIKTFPHKQAEKIVKVLNSRGNLIHWAELIQPDIKGKD